MFKGFFFRTGRFFFILINFKNVPIGLSGLSINREKKNFIPQVKPPVLPPIKPPVKPPIIPPKYHQKILEINLKNVLRNYFKKDKNLTIIIYIYYIAQ
jgi:hypothetical protein